MESKNDTKNETEDIKPPKEMKYYYRHREEILEKKRQKRLEDPEYQAKQKEKEDKKRQKEEERKENIKEKGRERAKKKAERLGILPASPPGVDKTGV
jgi:hypothetical protein